MGITTPLRILSTPYGQASWSILTVMQELKTSSATCPFAICDNTYAGKSRQGYATLTVLLFTGHEYFLAM
jgi:hypothetical protein